jgi:hypothetical protein
MMTHLDKKLTADRQLPAWVTCCSAAWSCVMLKEICICLQVYALEIEQYMKEFAQPVFEKAGVDHKVQHHARLPMFCCCDPFDREACTVISRPIIEM